MAAHRVYYGKGDQPVVTVLHRQGRPLRVASATYAILDVRYGETSAEHELVAAGTAAAVDAAAATLSARAGRAAADRRTITVTDTADHAAGRRYLLEAPDGRAELVRLAEVASPTQVLTIAEIAGDYPAGSTLRGVEVAASFPAVAADDVQKLDDLAWIIEWSAAGLPPIREMIHLHRGEEAQLATLDELLELDSSLAAAGGDRRELALALGRAHRDLRTDLLLAGAVESDLLTGSIGRDAVIYRAAHLALSGSNDESAVRRAEAYGKRYEELRAALQIGAKKPETVVVDKSTSSELTRISPASLFRPL